MCIEVCVGMCVGVCVGMCIDVCVDMFAGAVDRHVFSANLEARRKHNHIHVIPCKNPIDARTLKNTLQRDI